ASLTDVTHDVLCTFTLTKPVRPLSRCCSFGLIQKNQKIKARAKSADPTLRRRGNFKLAPLRQEVSLVRLLRCGSEPPILLRPVALRSGLEVCWPHLL